MELKQRKLIKNTKQLPGFATGYIGFLDNIDGLSSMPYANSLVGDYFGLLYGYDNSQGFNPNYEASKVTRLEEYNNQNQQKKTQTVVDNSNTSESAPLALGMGNPWATAGIYVGGLIGNFIGFKPKTAEEILSDAGISYANRGGIGYTVQNTVNTKKEMSNYDKDMAVNFLKSPGKALSMWWKRGDLKAALNLANREAERKNQFSSSGADTTYIQMRNNQQFGDTRTLLFRAAKGKPSYSNTPNISEMKPRKIATAEGWAYGIPNAKVSNGELIDNPSNTFGFRVPGLKNNKDTVYAYIRPSDRVIPNIEGLSDYAHKTGDVDGAEDMMKINNEIKAYKCGKLKGYRYGKLKRYVDGKPEIKETGRFNLADSLIPNAIGALTSIGLIIDAGNQRIKKSNTPYQNPYEKAILPQLASLRVNPLPIIRGAREAEGRLNRNINSAGGLSVAQRSFARMAGLTETQKNIADALANIQMQNNSYFTDFANTAMQAGVANAQRAMQAYAADLDYYSKAHAARNNMMNQGVSNFMSHLQNFSKQYNQSRLHNYMMDQYDDRRKQDWELIKLANKQIEAANKATNTASTNSSYKWQMPTRLTYGDTNWFDNYAKKYFG